MNLWESVINFFTALPPTFYGSLIGTLISSSVAISIMIHNNKQKEKEYNYSCYGAMKIITVQLSTLIECEKVTLDAFKLIKEHPDKKESLAQKLESMKIMFENINTLLEKERNSIPYSFISRYYTIINNFNFVITGYMRVINKPSDSNINYLTDHLKLTSDNIKRFMENSTIYIKDVEKKYKVKDFY